MVRCRKKLLWRGCKQLASQFEEGYYACLVASHVKKAGLKGETSNESTAGCGFEFNRVLPGS